MINLIPTPKKYHVFDEVSCHIKIGCHTDEADWREYVSVFADAFYRLHETVLPFEKGGIELVKDEQLAADHYTIDCGETVRVCASDNEGILYALASLLQLIEVKDGHIVMPRMCVEDYPDKEYRAFMIDLSRQWHPFEKLLRYVDICFLYKIKYLQLHFIDTNIYSLPSKVLPKLPTPSKHYSFEEIRRLNDYAKARGIVLIPEYECPGHGRVFYNSYPEIFGNHFDKEMGDFRYNEGGLKIPVNDLICAGSEVCMQANKDLLKEISDMFPDSPYLHIGGDEANVQLWEECSECKAYMEANQIDGCYDLYCDFVARIAEYVFSLGKTPIVWEGFPASGAHRIPKDTIVVAWESLYNLPQSLLDSGFRIINASWKPLYIVPPTYNAIPNARGDCRWDALDIMRWNVYNWQNWNPLSASYLNPITVQETDQVLGSMMCSWEMTYEQEINFVLENLAAMSERIWTVKRVCSDEEFQAKHGKVVRTVARMIQDR